jgi:hypothetical protein
VSLFFDDEHIVMVQAVCWLGGCFDVVNDPRLAEVCAGVAPAGEDCAQGEFERACLRSLVWVTANVQVIPSNEGTKKNSMEFESYAICKDVYGCETSSMEGKRFEKAKNRK